MSGKIMGRVWDLKLTAAKRMVLLAMADHADHNGENVYPGVELIAWKTGYSERQVKRIIEDLEGDKLLVPQGRSERGTNKFKVDIEAGEFKERFVSRAQRAKLVKGQSDKMSPNGSDKMSLCEDPSEVTNSHIEGDKLAQTEGDILTDLTGDKMSSESKNVLEPSFETSLETVNKDSEPSGSGARATETPKPRNELYDAVAKHIFEISTDQLPDEQEENGGRIGPIAAWLAGKSDGMKRGSKKIIVGFISNPAKPEHVFLFASYWKSSNPTANIPLDFFKFVDAWRKWASLVRTITLPQDSTLYADDQPLPAPIPEPPTPDSLLIVGVGGKTRKEAVEAAWGQLKIQYDVGSYQAYIGRATLVDWRDGKFIFTTPTPFVRDYLQLRLYKSLKKMLDFWYGEPTEMLFETVENGETPERKPLTGEVWDTFNARAEAAKKAEKARLAAKGRDVA